MCKTKGTLYTSYFAKLKSGRGVKLSIARYNPKWLKENQIDHWLQSLSPSQQLLNDYKYKGVTWDEYTTRYYNQIHSDTTANQFIKKIANTLDEGKDITLYCYEKPTDNCHRHLLAKLFKSQGCTVKEI